MRRLACVLIMMIAFSNVAFAGWETDGVGTKYKNEDESYKVGWYQDVDGKWYYFNDATGYMLKDTMTPDGYFVSQTGEWIKDGAENLNKKVLENEVSLNIGSLSTSSTRTQTLGYTVPVTVHYRDSYNNTSGGIISVKKIELSKEGAPYMLMSCSDIKGRIDLIELAKYTLNDGSVVELENPISALATDENFDYTTALVTSLKMDKYFRKKEVQSVEVWIHEKVN